MTAKHSEELILLRESMEAAHQAELQQDQVYFMCLQNEDILSHGMLHNITSIHSLFVLYIII